MATKPQEPTHQAPHEQSTAVAAASTGGSLALPTSVLERLAQQAKDEAAKERPSLTKISLRGGILSYAGAPMQGNKFECIVLIAAYRNAYYVGRFDPNNIVNPNCFAIAASDEGMVPHENVAEPEHDTCKGCPQSEWDSAGNNSRGKACKETRRLVLLPATALDDGPDKVKAAELAILDVPVTSVKNYSQFVNTLSVTAGVPAWAAICQVSVVPDPKTQFKVQFQAMRIVPNEQLLAAVEGRREEALRIALQPYDETSTKKGDPDATAAPVARKPAKF